MEVQPDFKELLKLFNKHQVEYIIVGGYALAFHGAPRYTGDIDLFVKSNSDNAQKILASLTEFGFGSLGLESEDFELPEQVVQLGVPPVRVDIITTLTGVSWQEAVSGQVEGLYGDVSVFYLGRNEMVVNKRALARKKDIADLESLGEDENWPEWWDWELELSPHLLKRMEDRKFNEVDLRTMLEHAISCYPDIVEGRWAIQTRHLERSWEVIIEPDNSVKLQVVITAYPIWSK